VKTRLYDDLDEFVALTRPLLEVDPVRHSIALLVLALLGRVPEASDVPPVLLTVSRGDALAGQWLCTPPREALVSGLPTDCAGAAAEVLAGWYPSLAGAVGSCPETALHRLTPPGGVPGVARRATVADVELLVQWRTDFANEALGGLRGHHSARQQVVHGFAAGTAAWL
jgi:hypothetical protein